MVTCNIDGKTLYHRIMEKLDNQKIFLFNKKCCKYFCDSISIGFTEEHLDLIFDLSHTLWEEKITKNAAGFLTFLDKVDWATDREFKRDVYFWMYSLFVRSESHT